MENKINIAELLKDCPRGMELDCTIFNGKICFEGFDHNNSAYPIKISINLVNIEHLNIYGQYDTRDYAKCVIFPKGRSTWEGFHRPFVEGDIVSTATGMYIGIVKSTEDNHECCTFCSIHGKQDFHVGKKLFFSRLATKEEKAKLFKAIEDNGYKWNPETKTLDELFPYKIGTKVWTKFDKEHKYIHTIVGISRNSFGNLEYEIEEEKTGTVVHYPKNLLIPVAEEKPKFKVGDKVRHKINNKDYIYEISKVYDDSYGLVDFTWVICMKHQDNWELVPGKFDITTLKPFESRVLVRDNDYDEWKGAFWSHLRQKADIKYDTIRGVYRQCIPYNDDTKHLLGKTNDCSEFYKTWK